MVAECRPKSDFHVLAVEGSDEVVHDISLAVRQCWPRAHVVAAHLGRTGLKLVESEPLDLIVLGLELPDMDGLEVLQQMRLSSTAPIVTTGTRRRDVDVCLVLRLGANAYLPKPFCKEQLVQKIRHFAGMRMPWQMRHAGSKQDRGRDG
jgi:DNA-binding response OmpR family regulator